MIFRCTVTMKIDLFCFSKINEKSLRRKHFKHSAANNDKFLKFFSMKFRTKNEIYVEVKPNQSSQLNDYLSRLNKLTLNSLYCNIINEDIEGDDGAVSFLK